jgi:hypothetical protein
VSARAILLQQKSNKNQAISSWAYQTIYVELIKVKVPPLSCLPLTKTALRSKYKLPVILNDSSGDMIESVVTLEGKTLSLSSVSDSAYKYSKYNLTTYTAIINDGYLYVLNNDFLKVVVIRAVFQDPIEVYLYPNHCDDCEQCKCKDITEIEFPIDAAGLDTVTDIAIQKTLSVFVQMTEDRENNATDDTGGRAMIHQPQQTTQ